jgi:hypothetical protein
MRTITFKLFEEVDPNLIAWLNSIPKHERSATIRQALRVYINKPDFVVRQRRNSKAVNE